LQQPCLFLCLVRQEPATRPAGVNIIYPCCKFCTPCPPLKTLDKQK
jgi:hypothetical protein